MSEASASADAMPDAWDDAALVAVMLAADPQGLGGVSLRCGPGPVREAWLALLRDVLPEERVMRRLPSSISEGRLLGGLDLAATLRAGRPIGERGLLAEADGGIVVVAMAERLTGATAAHLAATLDTGTVATARDGVVAVHPARIGLVLLDEGIAPDEQPPLALLDRVAISLDLSTLRRVGDDPPYDAADVARAAVGAAAVVVADKLVEAICGTALALGVWSLRPSMMALRVARLAAALAGRETATAGDATLAVRLVLAPRATRMPQRHEPAPEEQPDPPPSERQPDEPNSDEQPSDEPPSDAPNPADPPPAQDQDIPAGELAEILLAAAKSAIPAGLLDLLKAVAPQRARGSGTSGAMQKAGARGRPAGIRRALPQHGARLNLVETLRAAAPWQRLRQRETGETSRIQVRADDFHVTRHRPRTETTTIFAVDASGSSAAARLAEAKGAVELLLADCYVRRDSVAVIGFRGKTASILLPPTRSLVRAKRALAGLPGGGGTPIAAGLDCAAALAEQVRQRGQTPTIVMLTDGRANVGRDGLGGRAKAQEEALAAAAALRASGTACLLVDISPRPAPQGEMLADAMGARYVALPYADANLLSQAVRVAIGS